MSTLPADIRALAKAAVDPHAFGFSFVSEPWQGPTNRTNEPKDKSDLADAEAALRKAIADADQAMVSADPDDRKRLSDARDDLVGKLAQLKTGRLSGRMAADVARQASDAATQVSAIASVVAHGGSLSGGAIAAAEYRVLEQQSRDYLQRTSETFDRRTAGTVQDAKKFGVDVSEEQRKIDEAKRKEKESLERGDGAGALDARISGHDAHIAAMQKIIDSPTTPEPARAAYRLKMEDEIRERQKVAEQRLKMEEAKLKAAGVPEQDRAAMVGKTRAALDKELTALGTAKQVRESADLLRDAAKTDDAPVVPAIRTANEVTLNAGDAAGFMSEPTQTDSKAGHGLPPSTAKPPTSTKSTALG